VVDRVNMTQIDTVCMYVQMSKPWDHKTFISMNMNFHSVCVI
jgi:hypothetical protein